jgi:hypothetical protein
MSVTFYAWVRPVGQGDTGFAPEAELTGWLKWADHTWVTTYDNREYSYESVKEVVDASKQYWFCWGSFHPKGESAQLPKGLIGRAAGNVLEAECLCTSNVSSRDAKDAQGTIAKYGLDGVCHQLANQVMWATGTATVAPLTVKAARGYWVSNAAYGTYGKLHEETWKAKRHQCAASTGADNGKYVEVDDFAMQVGGAMKGDIAGGTGAFVLERRDQLQAKLKELKQTSQAGTVAVTAEMINAEIRKFQKDVAAAVSAEEYERIFEAPPKHIFNLVDPDIYDRGRRG